MSCIATIAPIGVPAAVDGHQTRHPTVMVAQNRRQRLHRQSVAVSVLLAHGAAPDVGAGQLVNRLAGGRAQVECAKHIIDAPTEDLVDGPPVHSTRGRIPTRYPKTLVGGDDGFADGVLELDAHGLGMTAQMFQAHVVQDRLDCVLPRPRHQRERRVDRHHIPREPTQPHRDAVLTQRLFAKFATDCSQDWRVLGADERRDRHPDEIDMILEPNQLCRRFIDEQDASAVVDHHPIGGSTNERGIAMFGCREVDALIGAHAESQQPDEGQDLAAGLDVAHTSQLELIDRALGTSDADSQVVEAPIRCLRPREQMSQWRTRRTLQHIEDRQAHELVRCETEVLDGAGTGPHDALILSAHRQTRCGGEREHKRRISRASVASL